LTVAVFEARVPCRIVSSTETAGTFEYANPPTIHWGAGSVAKRLDDALDRLGATRVFVITTRSIGSNPALAGALRRQLGERCVGQYASIAEHAPAMSIAEAADLARSARPDALVSLGGGSPIDATKAVAYSLATGVDFADAAVATQLRRLAPPNVLPHLAIPTTLSVAELSGMAGFSTQGEREKAGLRGSALLPRAVFYDAALSVHTPLALWLSSGIRAVDHAVETLLSPVSNPFSDTLCLEALRRLRRALLATHSDPADLGARTEAQLGAWLSFTLPGTAASGLSHTLGKRIGSPHGIPHGVTSCLLLPHAMRFLLPRTAPPQARIAEALGVDTRRMSLEQAAACAPTAVEELISQLGLPRHLGAYGLSEHDLVAAAEPLVNSELSLDDLVGIYRAAW
jgi:alcohol dehydrogenase class IV